MLYKLFFGLRDYVSFFNVFRYVTFRILLSVLTSMTIVFLMTPWVIEKLRSLSIKDEVRKDYLPEHASKEGTPTMGGILIVFSIFISSLLWNDLSNSFVWYANIVLLTFAAIGLTDDILKIKKGKKGLRGSIKFVLESIIAITIGGLLYMNPSFDTHLIVPFLKNITPNLGIFYILFVWLVVVGTSNAFNLTDGLDGLATGPMITTSSVYLVFAYVAGNAIFSNYLGFPFIKGAEELSIMLGSVIGAGIGFLWFNTYPAQYFLGDVGSVSLGGLLGVIAVMVKQELLLVIAGGIFVVEALSVIIQVGVYKTTKKRIFLMSPIHHHFQKLGWDEPKITVRFWIISIILSLIALSSLKLR